MACDYANRVTEDHEHPFGKGAIEGLAASETADDAAVRGAFVSMMTLGIPGDAVTAVMTDALFVHGLDPAPMPMIDRPETFWFVVGALLAADALALLFGPTGIRGFAEIVGMARGPACSDPPVFDHRRRRRQQPGR